MKRCFVERRFNAKSTQLIDLCNEIIDEYLAQGLRLTLRQIYYQLVSRDVIPNTSKAYKSLGSLLSDARLAGLVDWDAIEDRGRQPRQMIDFENAEELMLWATNVYRLPRWLDQENYVELWVEKDALSGVLRPISDEYHVTLVVNKGYGSSSSMYAAACRFKEAFLNEDYNGTHPGEAVHKDLHLLYLGDLDPSGEDMVRDIKDRLTLFEVDVHVRKLALTMEQVRQYRPPPNPAKLTDSRADAYVAKYGRQSWEVDALPPNVLQQLIRTSLDGLRDIDLHGGVLAREKADKKRLLAAGRKIAT